MTTGSLLLTSDKEYARRTLDRLDDLVGSFEASILQYVENFEDILTLLLQIINCLFCDIALSQSNPDSDAVVLRLQMCTGILQVRRYGMFGFILEEQYFNNCSNTFYSCFNASGSESNEHCESYLITAHQRLSEMDFATMEYNLITYIEILYSSFDVHREIIEALGSTMRRATFTCDSYLHDASSSLWDVQKVINQFQKIQFVIVHEGIL